MLCFSFKVILPKYTKNLPKPDVVIGSTVHPLAAWAGYILAKRHKVPFIYEVRDLWPKTLIDMKVLNKNNIASWALWLIDRFLARKSQCIISPLPYIADYYDQLKILSSKVVWIPNGVDFGYFPTPKPKDFHSKDFILMYLGAHGRANNLGHLLDAMALLKGQKANKNILLYMVGDGPEKSRLMGKAKKLKLGNVQFLDKVPKHQVGSICEMASAFIFNLDELDVFRYGISANKLFDFMACARPIIFSCNSKNNPVSEAQCGISIAPDDPQLLSQAIMTLAQLPKAEYEKMCNAGRSYVEKNHDFAVLAQKLNKIMENVLKH